MKATEHLRKGAETYESRNPLYGDNYKVFGETLKTLFPDGVIVKTVDDMNRLGVLVMILSKVGRYCNSFEDGGHADSIHDLMVYAAMLAELDDERVPF